MEDVKVYEYEYGDYIKETDEYTIEGMHEVNWKDLFLEMISIAIDKDYFPDLSWFKWPEEFYDEEGFNYDAAWRFVYGKMSEIFETNYED